MGGNPSISNWCNRTCSIDYCEVFATWSRACTWFPTGTSHNLMQVLSTACNKVPGKVKEVSNETFGLSDNCTRREREISIDARVSVVVTLPARPISKQQRLEYNASFSQKKLAIQKHMCETVRKVETTFHFPSSVISIWRRRKNKSRLSTEKCHHLHSFPKAFTLI